MNGKNIYTIIGLDTTKINWFPQTAVEEILQNVMVLLITIVGSVPLDRELGINATFVDEPITRGMMKASVFALETISTYEPRVEVTQVDYVPNPDSALEGRLYPRLVVRILDEYLA